MIICVLIDFTSKIAICRISTETIKGRVGFEILIWGLPANVGLEFEGGCETPLETLVS